MQRLCVALQIQSSRSLDVSMAVGCCLSMPERSAFSVFRSLLPTLARDFDMLEQVRPP